MPVSRARKSPHRAATQVKYRPNVVPLAARGARVKAAIIDRVVLPTVVVYAAFALAVLVFDSWDGNEWIWMMATMLPAGLMNELVGTARWGQTIGKRLMRIRVVTADGLEIPGWRRTLGRTFALWPIARSAPRGGLVVGVADDAAGLLSQKRQTLHDMVAGTIVVDDRSWRLYHARS